MTGETMELTLIRNIAIALGLGMLVGIQSEWLKNSFMAGVRTYSQIHRYSYTLFLITWISEIRTCLQAVLCDN